MNVKSLLMSLAVLLSAVLLLTSSANAAHVTGITIEPGATSGDTIFGGVHSLQAVDGSGLDASDPAEHTSALGGNLWQVNVLGNEGGDVRNVFSVLNLNGSYDLDSIRVWNFNWTGGRSDRGVREVDLAFSTDGTTFGATQTFGIAQAPGLSTYTGEAFTLASTVTASFVRLTLGVNHADGSLNGGANYGSDTYAGISEIQLFGNATVIPEPSSLGLLALAGMLGTTFLRRRGS